jgi:16S rRNA processing protein RimM
VTSVSGDEPRVQLVIGRIGRPHGVQGQVTVDVRTDDPQLRFAPGAALLTDPPERGPLVVAQARPHSGRLLLSFAGVEDRDAAERLRGTLLVAEIDPLASPEDPEEFYDYQLIGLDVIGRSGVCIGTVAEVLHLPGQDVLAIHRPVGEEMLVPFVAALVPEVDLAGRRMVIDPPPGLVEDVPETGERP